MKLYHGSRAIIHKPEYGIGNVRNDYGLAFYCTEIIELAKEWAVTESRDGFVNCYELDPEGLKVLHLGNGNYNILNWLAILLDNRVFRMNTDAEFARDYILENFLPDYKMVDVIRGYRADDSYFSFANAFLNNNISVETLGKVMSLGALGEQVAIKSEKAIKKIAFEEAIPVQRVEYYPKRKGRDETARLMYQKEKKLYLDGHYMMDIFRQRWRNDDERIQRIIY